MLTQRHCFQQPLGTEFPLDFPEAIFVPIALIATLSRRNLGIRNEGVWGHGIFEFIGIFIGCLRQRILQRNNATTQQRNHSLINTFETFFTAYMKTGILRI